MALVSSTTIISSISLFHLTLAYFFLANPSMIDDQTLVYIVGESLGIVSFYLPLASRPQRFVC
jgi:hypothetical protein